MIAALARDLVAVYADPQGDDADRRVMAIALRDALAAELLRAGTVVAELAAFTLTPELQDNRRGAVEFEEGLHPAPCSADDAGWIAAQLVPVFMFAASLEQRLNALRPAASTAACRPSPASHSRP